MRFYRKVRYSVCTTPYAAASKLSAVFRPLVYRIVLVLDIIGELEQGFINHCGLSNGTHYQLPVLCPLSFFLLRTSSLFAFSFPMGWKPGHSI